MSKQCSRCKEIKEISAFWKDVSKGDGIDHYCKACRKSMINKVAAIRGQRAYERRHAERDKDAK